MLKLLDPRHVICAVAYAKAYVITSESECERLFGILWKTTTVNGTVKSINTSPKGSGKQISLFCRVDIQRFYKGKGSEAHEYTN